ncbi:putative gibberellin 20 oxidase [Xylogone sp. PMI_703]|nr:putative gibberellin 20 oxidase [Xylogone sp. PMI_703]
MGSIVEIEIPIVDISGYYKPDNFAEKYHIADQVRDAYENQGFLQVVGHSVPQELQDRYVEMLRKFFALPLEEKEKLSQANSPCNRGYERIGGQKLDELDPNATPDQKEGFSVRRDLPPGGRFLQGENQWPDEALIPGFRDVYMEYYESVHQLSKTMFRIISLALGLDEHHFDYFASDPDGICLCRSHHYPPTKADQSGRTRGVGAHTDFGALTLLLQDDVGGLEVLHKPTGTWHGVPPIRGAYVVNIGDLMQRWTNDRFKSTMHRVISPLSNKDRYSCAFFNDGALDVVVECIPTCLKPGETPKYGPLKVEDHCINRYTQSYGAAGTEIKV